jgi:hypothetical protein
MENDSQKDSNDLEVKIIVDEGSTTKLTTEDEIDIEKAAEEEDEHTEAQTDAEAD